MRASLSNPFFATRARAVDLARQRYFEEGVPPAGVINEAVFQSWARCQRLHDRPERDVAFEPVTHSRAQLALQRNRTLLQAWEAEVPNLQALLGTTSCAAMLTDGTGVLIGATCAGRPHESLMPVATRLGVNLSEEAVGTTAPGIVVRTGQAVSVFGSEHYFEQVRQMQCAAAPIRDIHGALAGVLDLSSESIEFSFDAASVVGHLACTIENRLLIAQSADHLVVRIQVAPPLLDSSAVGMVGIRLDERVAWINGVAARLLGIQPLDQAVELPLAESMLGMSFGQLASLPCEGAAVLALPNGLSLWARSELRGMRSHQVVPETPQARALPSSQPAIAPVAAVDWVPTVTPLGLEVAQAAAPMNLAGQPSASRTVQTTHHELVQRTLQEHGGNLSKAARCLGVSRGWIYRRVRDMQQVK